MPLRQWMLAITAYADRLLGDLEAVDWDAGIKALQRAWIGRSEVHRRQLVNPLNQRCILLSTGTRASRPCSAPGSGAPRSSAGLLSTP